MEDSFLASPFPPVSVKVLQRNRSNRRESLRNYLLRLWEPARLKSVGQANRLKTAGFLFYSSHEAKFLLLWEISVSYS